jgi:hypothetical protein
MTFDIPALAATISAVSPWLFLEFVLQGITDNAIKAAIRRKNQWRVTVCGGTVKISAVVQKNLRRLRVPDGDNDT